MKAPRIDGARTRSRFVAGPFDEHSVELLAWLEAMRSCRFSEQTPFNVAAVRASSNVSPMAKQPNVIAKVSTAKNRRRVDVSRYRDRHAGLNHVARGSEAGRTD